MKKCAVACTAGAILLFSAACGGGETPAVPYNPAEGPYAMEDIVREELMWDTETLFAAEPEIETLSEINPGKNMTAIKFESVAYPLKDLDHKRTFAVVGVPDAEEFPMPEGGYPGIVLVHGGAGQVYPEWVRLWNEKGYVAIAIDVFGNELDASLNKKTNPEGGPTEGYSGSKNQTAEEWEDSWVYHCVADIILANDILRAREDVNPNQIGCTGISWGGVLTCIASGVDKRFGAFAPIYGAGYLYEDSFGAGGIFGGSAGSAGREAWISAYDPSAYLPYATKPMLFVSGIDDNCFDVVSRAKSIALVPGKVFASQRSDLEHGYYWDQTYEVYAFMEHVLRGEDTAILVTDSGVREGKVYIEIENPGYVEQINFLYTTDSGSDSHSWRFESMSLEVSGRVEIDLPEGTTAFAFECANFTVDMNFRMGSPVYLVE